MCKIIKMLSKILTVALVGVTCFSGNAMQFEEQVSNNTTIVQPVLTENISEDINGHHANAYEQPKYGKIPNVAFGMLSIPFLMYTSKNIALGGAGFLLFAILAVVF